MVDLQLAKPTGLINWGIPEKVRYQFSNFGIPFQTSESCFFIFWFSSFVLPSCSFLMYII